MNKRIKVVVIGGGAAGFFGAITCAQIWQGCEVIILEKSTKILSKVKISGGGRCNVTHACYERSRLLKHYPRGEKTLPGPFTQFAAHETVNWFEQRGVRLKTEADGRMFPVTDNSQTIIDCLVEEAKRLRVQLRLGWGVASLEPSPDSGGFTIIGLNGEKMNADRVLVATGGNPNPSSYQWLARLGHQIINPVPSLFTFNVPGSYLLDLSGVSVPVAKLKISGTKWEQTGPLLVTHWGFSGPAVLKLSAWGARDLAAAGYRFTLQINWVPDKHEEAVRTELLVYREEYARKIIASHPLYHLPQRLWKKMVEQADIAESVRWADLPKKNFNKLIDLLVHSTFAVEGKSTFKDEFVTCGGIASGDINWQTMESRRCPGLYFAGEVLDVDGVTGGFNFQSAWTTGYIAGKHIGS